MIFHTDMKILLLSALLFFTVPSSFAKRIAPAAVPLIEFDELRIKVLHWKTENNVQNGGYIEARDQSNKLVWFRVLYKNHGDPSLESDIQDIFIKTVELRGKKPVLVIKNENGATYYLNPKNGNSLEQ